MDEKSIHQYSLRVHQAAALYTAAGPCLQLRTCRAESTSGLTGYAFMPDTSASIAPATPAAPRSRKLHRRFAPIVFAFYMSAIMAFLMCCAIVGANSGLAPTTCGA
jgi:hypothetical protein